jgi:thiol-disulfide isomerase/thioredoxin
LAGQVVLVDCWATWCPPCRASMPKLARIYEKYRTLGVEFVGITPEGAVDRPAVEGFIGTVAGFDWPVGVGATPTLHMLGVSVLPTMVVFGKDGLAVWSSTSTEGLEAALDEALANGM